MECVYLNNVFYVLQATREKALLKNSYFQFIASLVNNNVAEVILSQG
jgi:hypothetical protein